MRLFFYSSIISISFIVAATITVRAQAGSLDLGFGSGGKVTTDFGSGLYGDVGYSMTIQDDGKIVVAGYSYNGTNNDIALARYNSNGTLDNTFDSDGKATTDIGGSDDRGTSVAIQGDGKILVAGYSSSNLVNYEFALVRYKTDGSLDSTFSSDGKVTTAFGTARDEGYSLAIQSDGKIVVAGYSSSNFFNNYDIALARYNSDGSLDNTFSSDGKVLTSISVGSDIGYSVAIQSDGKIIVAGSSFNGTDDDFALVRYNSDGSLDSTFNTNGTVTTDVAGFWDIGRSVAIQSDGKIVVAGGSSDQDIYYFADFALVRYKNNGTPDSTFNSNGKVITNFGSIDYSYSVIIQSDGKIVTAGFSTNEFALARYNNDGSLDNTFGSNGKITTLIGYSCLAYSVALQIDYKIVVAGYSSIGANNDFAIARYNVDTAVGIGGNIPSENIIHISPNPFTTELIVSGTMANGELTLFDILGKEILRQETFSSETKINTEKLLPGIYLLNYTSGNETQNMRVIKL